jgi:hypothetical protein
LFIKILSNFMKKPGKNTHFKYLQIRDDILWSYHQKSVVP